MSDAINKVTAGHLRRDAYLYVRQSTLYQVANNTESTRRQYDLRGRAVALGWPAEHVIPSIRPGPVRRLGCRPGRLPASGRRSASGQAGIVLGLEVSRLARNQRRLA